jgi:predicted outer membrane repeat protein
MIKLSVRLAVLLSMALAILAGPQAARATGPRCYVKAGAAGFNNGSSWANAFTHLQTALTNVGCTQIWVAAGVYKPTTYVNAASLAASFSIGQGVAVYGGFGGTETLLSQRNLATHVTILSGDIDGNDTNTDGNHIDETTADIQGNNSYHVVYFNGGTTPVTGSTRLDGFTITGGHANGTYPNSYGGGMFCYGEGAGKSCSPTLTHLTFSGNLAGGGGAIMNDGQTSGNSSPALTGVTFSGNAATGTSSYGGAIYDWGGTGGHSSPTLTNVTFSGNSATGGAFNYGGAIYNDGGGGTSSPHVRNATFSGNSAAYGGAMYSDGSTPTLTNSILWGNTANGISIPNGQEICDTSSTTSINYSIVQGGDGGSCGGTEFSSGTGNLSTDPKLNPLAANGGAVKTQTLRFGSAAVDTGTNTGCPSTDARGIGRPKDGDGNGSAVCDMGATESQWLTAKLASNATSDGWILESGENTSVGGSLDASGTAFNLGDDAANKQYRSILTFQTAAIPSKASIRSIKLEIRKAGQVGANPFSSMGNIIVDIRKGGFSSNVALQNADFQAAASKVGAMTMTNSPSGTGWYAQNLASPNFVYINRAGVTQFRLRFATDDNNNHVADYLTFYSGNYGTASSRPQLVVAYYLP